MYLLIGRYLIKIHHNYNNFYGLLYDLLMYEF